MEDEDSEEDGLERYYRKVVELRERENKWSRKLNRNKNRVKKLKQLLNHSPEKLQSKKPNEQPTLEPDEQPTLEPDEQPTLEPDEQPTLEPDEQPTLEPHGKSNPQTKGCSPSQTVRNSLSQTLPLDSLIQAQVSPNQPPSPSCSTPNQPNLLPSFDFKSESRLGIGIVQLQKDILATPPQCLYTPAEKPPENVDEKSSRLSSDVVGISTLKPEINDDDVFGFSCTAKKEVEINSHVKEEEEEEEKENKHIPNLSLGGGGDSFPKKVYNVGDLVWARIICSSYHPALITKDSDFELHRKLFKSLGNTLHYHVQFLGDKREMWLPDKQIIPYEGLTQYENLASGDIKNIQIYRPGTEVMKSRWRNAVLIAKHLETLEASERIRRCDQSRLSNNGDKALPREMEPNGHIDQQNTVDNEKSSKPPIKQTMEKEKLSRLPVQQVMSKNAYLKAEKEKRKLENCKRKEEIKREVLESESKEKEKKERQKEKRKKNPSPAQSAHPLPVDPIRTRLPTHSVQQLPLLSSPPIPSQPTTLKRKAFVTPFKKAPGEASNILDISKSLNLKVKPVKPAKNKEKLSDVFKEEATEAKNVARIAKQGSKIERGVKKMMKFNQTFLNTGDKDSESSAKRQKRVGKKVVNWESVPGVSKSSSNEADPLQDSPDSLPMSPSLMVSPVKPRKLELLEEDELEEDAENDSNEYVPDLDELLKLPERPADGSKTKDEILDEFDRQIAERQRLHEEEMAILEADIEAENEKRRQRKLRLKENAKLRNLLETKLTEPLLRSMFQDNLQYFKDLWSGKVESLRHMAFHQSTKTRHALYYKIITDPFTDEQLDWTLDEISKVWMSNRRDHLNNKDYVWRVLISECFIKFYMDFFSFSKNEAMTRISETPLHKKDRLKEFMSKSDEEESEEDDVVACDDRHKEEEVTMCADRHEEEVVIKCEEGNQRDEEAADSSNHTDETGGPSEGARINNVERHNNIVAYLKSGSVIEYEGELFQTRIPEISPFQNDLPFTKEHLQIEGLTNDSNSCAFISIIIALHRIRLVEHLFGEGCANMWTECLRYYLSALPNKDEFSLYPLLTAWNRLGHPKIAIGSFLDATEVVGQMFSHDRTNIKSNTLTRFFGSFSCPHCGLEEESLSCEGMTTNPFCPTLSLPQQTGEEAINVHELMRQFLQKPFPTRCTSCRGIVLDAKIKPKVGNFTIISLNRRMGNVSGTKNLANVVTYPVSDNVVDNICKETLATVNHSGIDPKDGGHFVAYSKIGNKWSRNDDNKRIVFPSHNPFQLNSSFGETVDIIFYKCQT